MRWTAILVTLLAALAGYSAPVSAQPARHAPWWRSPRVQGELALTQEQIRQIDTIYQQSLPNRRRLRDQLAAAQARLARVIAETPFDDDQLRPLVDRVCDVQKDSNVARTLMLVRMYQVLSPVQRTRLADIAPRSAVR